jgi:Uncharacterized conserved protein
MLFVLLAFTDVPFHAYAKLATPESKLKTAPDYIIVMGSDGIPSPSGLLATYYGIKKAQSFPKAKIVLALPALSIDDEQLIIMKEEFLDKGIAAKRILFEHQGHNTVSQVRGIKKLINDQNAALLIVSKPEHMYRCIATFKKAGFTKVGGHPTFESPSEEGLLKSKSKEAWAENNLSLRYNLWSYMQYEIRVLREYTAIAYYWANGWI